MKRIMVVGGPGSGKSTLARQIGERLQLPIVHLDRIQWLPGWVERDRQERDAMMLAEAEKETWVIDGNYSATRPARIARAELIVWLDLPLVVRLWRVYARVWRTRISGASRPDMTPGCPEKVDREFLYWILSTRRKMRRGYSNLMAELPADRMVRLDSRRAVDRWLQGLPS